MSQWVYEDCPYPDPNWDMPFRGDYDPPPAETEQAAGEQKGDQQA